MAALTLTGGVAITDDSTFQARVALGFYYVARSVLAEAATTAGNFQRVTLARSIIAQPYSQFVQYAAMVVTDKPIVDAGPATQAAVTDTQIISAITRMWNVLANVESV